MIDFEKVYEKLREMKPPPLNPDYRPWAVEVRKEVVASMQKDGFYEKNTRKEGAKEFKKRYQVEFDRREKSWKTS